MIVSTTKRGRSLGGSIQLPLPLVSQWISQINLWPGKPKAPPALMLLASLNGDAGATLLVSVRMGGVTNGICLNQEAFNSALVDRCTRTLLS